MSRRSIVRDHNRRLERSRKRAARTLTGAGAAVGATLAMAGSADAANFEVTNTNDSGAGSLRQAVADIAVSPPGEADTITFAPNVTGTIALTSGQLDLSQAVSIEGPGRDVLKISGGGTQRIFNIEGVSPGNPDDFSISGLTLSSGGGVPRGGAIYSGVLGGAEPIDLTITDSALTGNQADDFGGAIASSGNSLEIADSILTGNKIAVAGGNDYGGAIYVQDTSAGDTGPEHVAISTSRLNGNTAIGDGGALYASSLDGLMTITDSTLAGNKSEEDGGALVVNGLGSSFQLTRSAVTGNQAEGAGGGIWVLGVSGATTISDSTIANNVTSGPQAYGGGIASYQEYDGPVTVRNSTVTGNRVVGTGGNGGGIYRLGSDSGTYPGADAFFIKSSIISGNSVTGGGLGPDLYNPPAATGRFQVGTTLISNTTNALITQSPAGSNILNQGAQLGPLTDNGGPTLTMMPAIGSPAIDAGVADGLTVDQRGFPRTVEIPEVPNAAASDGTDMGAAEFHPPNVIDPFFQAKKKQKVKKKVIVKVKAGAAEDVTATFGGSIKAKKKFKLKPVTTDIAGEEIATVKLKPAKKKASKKILKVLKKGKKAKAKVPVTLVDGLGNEASKTLKVKLKVKKKKGGGK